MKTVKNNHKDFLFEPSDNQHQLHAVTRVQLKCIIQMLQKQMRRNKLIVKNKTANVIFKKQVSLSVRFRIQGKEKQIYFTNANANNEKV